MPPLDGRSDAGRFARIDGVHVEREVKAIRLLRCQQNGFGHDGAQAALVDLAHGADADAGLLDVAALQFVHRADGHHHHVARVHLRRPTVNMSQLRGTHSDAAGQRHAVNVAAGAGLRRVHVGVGVDPEQAHLLAVLAMKLRGAGDGSDGDGMIAAEHQRKFPVVERPFHLGRQAHAGVGDLGEIARVGRPFGMSFGLGDGDVAQILHLIAERSDAGVEIGHANRGSAHIHAAAPGAQIERRSDDGDLRWSHDSAFLRDESGRACAGRRWFREYAPARTSRRRTARRPCQSRHAERCRTCGDRDTS